MAEQRKKLRLGELLVQQGLITPDQLGIALAEQKQNNIPIGRQLVRLGFITEAAIRDIMARTVGQESIDLAHVVADPEALRLVPQDFARRHRVLPIAYDADERQLTIATTEIFNVVALDQLRASYAEDAEVPYERLLEQIRTAPLVILDDLDAYADTAWAREKFYQVVSHRFHAALPTVFTCDRAPEEIDDRLGARLTDPALAQVFVLAERERERTRAADVLTILHDVQEKQLQHLEDLARVVSIDAAERRVRAVVLDPSAVVVPEQPLGFAAPAEFPLAAGESRVAALVSNDALAALIDDPTLAGDPAFRIFGFVGYAGWDAGQLENELRLNAWITCRFDRVCARLEGEACWKALLLKHRPDLRLAADSPEDPRLN